MAASQFSTVVPVPDVLRQKCLEIERSARVFESSDPKSSWTGYQDGKILMWKGQETKYFWTSNNAGKIAVYGYQNGTEQAQILMEHDFGNAANIVDAIYFPISDSCRGIAVAVSDQKMDRYPNFLAYFSLESRRLLKCVYIVHPITCIYGVLDGTSDESAFQELAEQFHSGWPHVLLVGCRYGFAYLVHFDITGDDYFSDDDEHPPEANLSSPNEPVRSKKTVPLSKIFYQDEMFVFGADDGVTKCLNKEKVYVSALTYIEKSKLVVIGFNFGGILIISLKTSKVISLFYAEGSVKFFALQEPEEDPRPILFFWVCMNISQKGTMVVLLSINFPKDEAATKNPAEYTYEEPVFIPALKWYPDSCSQMISMRTLYIDKQKLPGVSKDSFYDDLNSTGATSQANNVAIVYDTSLMLMVWIENRKGQTAVMHGSLFDLNAYYNKRLVGRVSFDSTIAKQMHFFSRFSTLQSFGVSAREILDVCADSVYRFAPPAFLKDSIDQLYYPSVYYITANCLLGKKFVQVLIQPIQIQLIANISENIEQYFEAPREPCKWICAIGLANSEPAQNTNEEKACLLRVLVHNYFPGILKLIESCDGKADSLKFIQKWVWKELEQTKTKFDDMCSPLFAMPPLDLSPSARGFIHHARVFFRRASLILECIGTKIAAFEDEEWENSLEIQHKASRQVQMFSYGIAFALVYNLLPVSAQNSKVAEQLQKAFADRFSKIHGQGKQLQILELIAESMDLDPDQTVWQRKTAEEWYPPNDFSSFLPVLLLMYVSEVAKLTMMGYYCLDVEKYAPKDSMQEKLFDKCCSFFMQEEFSLEVMNGIRKMWLEDKRLTEMDVEAIEQMETSNLDDEEIDESQLKWLPLCTSEEIEYAKAEYLKLDHGIHRFNMNVIEKRRFNLIMEASKTSTSADEPDFVVESRAKCFEVRQRFPWIFKKIEKLPQFVLDKYRENLENENKEQESFLRVTSRKRPLQPQIRLNVKHDNNFVTTMSADGSKMSRATGWTKLVGAGRRMNINNSATSDDALQAYEELPLTIATPAKRQRVMLFPPTPVATVATLPSSSRAYTELKKISSIRNQRASFSEKKTIASTSGKKGVRTKDLDRVNRVIQTPLSLTKGISRIPIRRLGRSSRLLFPQPGDQLKEGGPICSTPTEESVTPVNTPTSILKQSEKKSRLPSSMKPRLRFAVESKTEQIPSRAEKLMEEKNDTSFSTFAVLSTTESSASPTSEPNNSSVFVDSPEANIIVETVVDVTPVPIQNFEEQEETDVRNANDDNDDEASAEQFKVPTSVPAVQESKEDDIWVKTHLRRSTRLRSPRKIFDEKREFK